MGQVFGRVAATVAVGPAKARLADPTTNPASSRAVRVAVAPL